MLDSVKNKCFVFLFPVEILKKECAVNDETKAWWKSKTIWVNVISLIIALATVAIDSPVTNEALDKVLLSGVAAINIILRLVGRPTELTIFNKTIK